MDADMDQLQKLWQTIEVEAIKLMYMASSSSKSFVMREGDSHLASLDRLLPDFYDIFTRNADLSYQSKWGLVQMFFFTGPLAIMFLLMLVILANRVIEVAIEQLVSLSVICSHIIQHGLQLSQPSTSMLLSGPLRVLRWLDFSEGWVQLSWYQMPQTKNNTKDEVLRQLCSAVYRIREERALLQKRRSDTEEGAAAADVAGSPSPVAKPTLSPRPADSL